VPKKFTYRGHTLEELQKMSMNDFVKLLPSRERRSLLRGMPPRQKKLLERIRKMRNRGKQDEVFVRTHCRDIVIIPEMVGIKLGVHNGKDFVRIEITPEMVGHRIGEFALSRKKVTHSTPGIGATRSSLYVPLK
jgi:small subunit ribosomal protein S19